MVLHSLGVLQKSKSNIFLVCHYLDIAFLKDPIVLDLEFVEDDAVKHLKKLEKADPTKFYFAHVISGK